MIVLFFQWSLFSPIMVLFLHTNWGCWCKAICSMKPFNSCFRETGGWLTVGPVDPTTFSLLRSDDVLSISESSNSMYYYKRISHYKCNSVIWPSNHCGFIYPSLSVYFWLVVLYWNKHEKNLVSEKVLVQTS